VKPKIAVIESKNYIEIVSQTSARASARDSPRKREVFMPQRMKSDQNSPVRMSPE
jgi:hypothetical protein